MSEPENIKNKYGKENNPNRPPPVDPKYTKEDVRSMAWIPYSQKTHKEWYDSKERATHIEERENAPREEKTSTKYMGGKKHSETSYKKDYDPTTETIKEETREETPNQRKENWTFKDGQPIRQEFSETFYDENRQTITERHGVNERSQKKIDINQESRNGRVTKKIVDTTFHDAEIGAEVHLHEASEDITTEQNVEYVTKGDYVTKKIITRKGYNNVTNTFENEQIVREFPITERQVNVKSIDNIIYETDITETSFENGIQITKHGIDQKRLDCGHVMQGTIYRCSYCGKTICGGDDCGVIVNGRVLCTSHALMGCNFRQLYQ